MVKNRTEEIEAQKTEIEAQRDFALSQHKLISQQKKTITDSINYALEIQRAVLPDEDILKKYFRDSFILFRPKDFVSGDFYYLNVKDDKIIVAAADCGCRNGQRFFGIRHYLVEYFQYALIKITI